MYEELEIYDEVSYREVLDSFPSPKWEDVSALVQIGDMTHPDGTKEYVTFDCPFKDHSSCKYSLLDDRSQIKFLSNAAAAHIIAEHLELAGMYDEEEESEEDQGDDE